MTNKGMPPRAESVEFISIDDEGLTVGKVIIPGAGLRIGLQCDGNFMHMSPAGARRFARGFESEEARANGLAWVADALREAADEVEAATATKQ